MNDFDTIAERLRGDTPKKATSVAAVGTALGFVFGIMIASYLLMIAAGVFKHTFDAAWMRNVGYFETMIFYIAIRLLMLKGSST